MRLIWLASAFRNPFIEKSSAVFWVLAFLLTLSCSNNKVTNLTYDLKRTDFVEKISVTGTIEAVNNLLVTTPRSNYGLMNVLHLAEDGSYVKKVIQFASCLHPLFSHPMNPRSPVLKLLREH